MSIFKAVIRSPVVHFIAMSAQDKDLTHIRLYKS